ncbi:MAG: hypothetical protein AAGI66_06250 [Cyanobacteria bacterium P01_H01_bin.74]
MTTTKTMTFRRGRPLAAYRSGLEKSLAQQLKDYGISVAYESETIHYTQEKGYTPDFILPNGIIIESKGYFDPEDRRKHLEIQQQWPELDLRFIFSNPNNKIRKGSKTTYAMWCEKNGFKWAKQTIPKDWLLEGVNHAKGTAKD